MIASFRPIITCLITILLTLGVPAGAQVKTHLSPIGPGWAKNAVNTPVFRKNSVASWNDVQVAAFYDSTGSLVLAKRKMDTDMWEVHKTQYSGNVKDAHNSISIMLDGEGYLHVAWDHHDNPLNYARGTAPGAIELGEKMSMTASLENKVTYPEFHQLPDGNLLFLYRNGASGRGNLVMNKYNVSEKKWRTLHSNLIDGENERNAYWQAFVDLRGTIHLSWVWRETWDVATNHDICYARSTDGGINWEKSDGEKYVLPITLSNAEYACKIPQSRELINQTTMYADSKSRPYVANYWRPEGSDIPQYHLVYYDGKKWNTTQVSDRKTAFSLSGGGTKKIPISRPQIIINDNGKKTSAYLLFRDEERGSKVSLSYTPNLGADWKTIDLTDFSVGNWEPSYDTELWKKENRLHIFVQKTGQGDGETLEDLDAEMVYVLEGELPD